MVEGQTELDIIRSVAAFVILEVLLRLNSSLQSNTNRDNVGDHAAKHWAGLVDSYFFRLWNIFFHYVTTKPMCSMDHLSASLHLNLQELLLMLLGTMK